MSENQKAAGKPRDDAKVGRQSFCIPKAAIHALLDAKATAHEICAYLTLAQFTDATGVFSSASIKACNTSTGSNKAKIERAIERLKTIHAYEIKKVSNGRSGKAHAWIEERKDLGAIVYSAESWSAETGEVLPDAPFKRAEARHVLPDFGEPLAKRVWIGSGLVLGVGDFDKPLKQVKDAGDAAARILLWMYLANDMEGWGGVRPVSQQGEPVGTWRYYMPVADDAHLRGGARLIRSKRQGNVLHGHISRFAADNDSNVFANAIDALDASGLISEVVMVLNRNGKASTFGNGGEYLDIPPDAEPYCELDVRHKHGYKAVGEKGIGGATAKTAADFGKPVATEGGTFDGTYAAIVQTGKPAMIAGIYRLRFRVANAKNVGVKDAWERIEEGNREAFGLVQSIRVANGFAPLIAPWEETPKEIPIPF